MEVEALTAACKHLALERDVDIFKLRKQKHASHQMVHRLKKRLASLELTARLLLASYIVSCQHNRELMDQITSNARLVLD